MKKKLLPHRTELLVVCLISLFENLQAQQPARFLDSKFHKNGKIWVGVTNFGQIGPDREARAVVWPGTDIPGWEAEYINRGGFYFGGIVPSDLSRGPDLHAPGDLDTLVSEGLAAWSVVDFREMFPHYADGRSAIKMRSTRPNSGFFSPSAVSEEDFISVYADTFLAANGSVFVPPKHQRALGLEVVERSYQFSQAFAEDLVFFDLVIRNIGKNHIRNFYVGLFANDNIGCIGGIFTDRDDAAGFMPVNSVGDTVNTAWVVDTGGAQGCLPGVVGVRILRPSAREARLSFNWWTVDTQLNSKDDWGPVTPNVYTGDPNDRDPIGSPVNDPAKYLLMSNGSIDEPQFDPVTFQFDSNIPVGTFPNDPSRFLLSIGPLGTRDSTITNPDDRMFGQTVKIFAPGDSILFTLAIIGGEGDPLVAQALGAFDPAAFVDLGRNAVIAGSMFDTPGIDTDGDGFAGEDRDHDGFIETGDGVPDFKGPPPPPSPPLRVITSDREVILDWSAADPHSPNYEASNPDLPLNFRDPFFSNDPNTPEDERQDFEGFRVLRSRTGELGTFELLAEFDLPDNESGRNTGLAFRYVDHIPNGETFYYAVVSFDRGDPALGLESLESSPLLNLIKAMASPQPSAGFGDKPVWVEPNPFIERAGFLDLNSRNGGTNANSRLIDFVNVPARCTIRILTLDGDLVRTLQHNDPHSSRVRWDLLSRTGRPVATGLYIFAVETPEGDRQISRFVVIK